MSEPRTTTNRVLRRVEAGLSQLQGQPKPTLAAHRLKVARRELAIKFASVGEDVMDVARKYGTENERGAIEVPRDLIATVNAEIDPILNEVVELPRLKSITYADLADVQVSEDTLDALEEIGLLTGSPEPVDKTKKEDPNAAG